MDRYYYFNIDDLIKYIFLNIQHYDRHKKMAILKFDLNYRTMRLK